MKKWFMNVGLILFAGFCLVCLGSSVSYGQLRGTKQQGTYTADAVGLYGGLYGGNITSGGQMTNPVDAILINPQPEPPRYIPNYQDSPIRVQTMTDLDVDSILHLIHTRRAYYAYTC